ncbi:MAG: hypothetical protein PHX13_07080 [Thiovulaceae bacterium]|nr:hypothetical protein [Sulfurimonadaceae bacterium]
MSFSVTELSNILKLASASPTEAKALIKLLAVDVSKLLGDGKYLLETPTKNLTAFSEKPLQNGSKYWVELSTKPHETLIISKFLQQPKILQELQNLSLKFDTKELHELLSGNKTIESFKTTLLDHLSTAVSKDDFTQVSNLLLSLMQNTITIPLLFGHSFGVFQMKKRYNKTTKKSQLDFYAALLKLGPISGTIMFIEDEIFIDLDVAFITTKLFLEANLKDIRYKITLHVRENIDALYQFQTNSLLDINA